MRVTLFVLATIASSVGAGCPQQSSELSINVENATHLSALRFEYVEQATAEGRSQTASNFLNESTVICSRHDSCFKLEVLGSAALVDVSVGGERVACTSQHTCLFQGCISNKGEVEWLTQGALQHTPHDSALHLEAESAQEASARMIKVFDELRKLSARYDRVLEINLHHLYLRQDTSSADHLFVWI